MSVCYVDCPTRNVSTQCVIVKLSPELRNALPVRRSSSSSSVASANRTLPDALTLALIAPHTLLYCESPKELRDWRLYTGVESTQKSGGLKLHERYISDSFSCCGPRGVWGSTSPHTGTYVHESSCPFHADFVVFILKPELTDQLKDVLTIPCLPSLDESHFSQALHSVNHYLSLIQRGPSGAAETYRVLLKPPSPLSGNDLSIEDQMAAYNEMSRPQYTCGRSDSRAGAAVVYFDSNTPDNALVLAAMHLYSRRDDEIFTYCAISLPAIFHSIAGQTSNVKLCTVSDSVNRGHLQLGAIYNIAMLSRTLNFQSTRKSLENLVLYCNHHKLSCGARINSFLSVMHVAK